MATYSRIITCNTSQGGSSSNSDLGRLFLWVKVKGLFVQTSSSPSLAAARRAVTTPRRADTYNSVLIYYYVPINVHKGNLSFKTLSYQTERAMKMFMMSNLCSGAWRSLSLSHCWSRLRPRYKSLTSQDTLKQSVVKNLEILFTDWGSDTLKQSVVRGVTGWRNLWSWLERRHLPHDSLTGLSKQPLIEGLLILCQWQILFWKLLLWIIFCRYCPSGQLFCKLLSWRFTNC